VNFISHLFLRNIYLKLSNNKERHCLILHAVFLDVNYVTNTDVTHFDGEGAVGDKDFVVVLVVVAV